MRAQQCAVFIDDGIDKSDCTSATSFADSPSVVEYPIVKIGMAPLEICKVLLEVSRRVRRWRLRWSAFLLL